MTEQQPELRERAQVGIGTLIVFIAMVLVAAIAAGVLINTAGFLQSSAEESGQQAGEQVTDRLEVISEVGTTSSSSGPVDSIQLDVKRAPGAGDIDLQQITAQWVGPQGQDDLTGGDFSISAVQAEDDTNDVISADSDVYTLTLSLNSGSAPGELSGGESATLSITTASGGSTEVRLTTPESLTGEDAVSL